MLKKKFFIERKKKNCQLKGICFKVLIKTPRKPNSAKRAIIKFKKKKFYCAFVPGIGHNLKKFFFVLISYHNVKDLPQIRLFAIRGKFDLLYVLNRTTCRSFYGVSLKKKFLY